MDEGDQWESSVLPGTHPCICGNPAVDEGSQASGTHHVRLHYARGGFLIAGQQHA